ncbi:hypothetical protein Desaci_1337 [Desulfosporosinus acidiphilus SJ4]|uniref:Uncharacterized protein n=2 Tax=Desulfosporosinus TaxID=79206 RepID=A0A0J1FQN9_9FIRM|nr:hypothetical protein Desaci_1337 [Desulfosporosinus acidiphilus SJ4]KLU65819.1 hypothetical protein DEAC_c24490 [Desulfosporosinus acididurans]
MNRLTTMNQSPLAKELISVAGGLFYPLMIQVS